MTIPPALAADRFNAEHPDQSGYRLSFQDDFTDPSTIDLADTRRDGFKWYMGKFNWGDVSRPDQVVPSKEGLILSGRIATASATFDGRSLVGKAWGGSLFFEAMLNLDPTKVFSGPGLGSSFWGYSWSHAIGDDQATNMPRGYRHFGELDFMEYGFANQPDRAPDLRHYSQTVHDWYGIERVTCKPDAFCDQYNDDRVVRVPDISGWHRIGALLTVGKSGQESSVQAYFDGMPVGDPRKWRAFTKPEDVPVPPTKADFYSILDFEKWIVVLSATGAAPMTVRYVKIWRAPED